MSWSLTRKGKAARNLRIKLPCSSSSSFVIFFLFIEKVNLWGTEKYQIDSSGKWKPLLIQHTDVAQSGLMRNASLRSKGIIASSLAGTGSLPQPSSKGISESTSSGQSWSAQNSVECLHFSVPLSLPSHPARGAGSRERGRRPKQGGLCLWRNHLSHQCNETEMDGCPEWCLCTCVDMGVVHGQHYRPTGSQGIHVVMSRTSSLLPKFFSSCNSLGKAVSGGELDLGYSVFIVQSSGTLCCVWGRLFVFILHFYSEVCDFFHQGENLSNGHFRLPRNYEVLESIKA